MEILTLKTLDAEPISVLLDEEDIDRVEKFPYLWTINGEGIIYTSVVTKGRYAKVTLSQLVMQTDNNALFKHINRDKTDFRESNLSIIR